MQEQLITFETAKLVKEKSFDIPVDGRYYWDYKWKLSRKGATQWKKDEDSYPAPTQSLLQKWIRESNRLYIEIYVSNDHINKKQGFQYLILKPDKMVIKHLKAGNILFNTYEEALEEGLKQALELI